MLDGIFCSVIYVVCVGERFKYNERENVKGIFICVIVLCMWILKSKLISFSPYWKRLHWFSSG